MVDVFNKHMPQLVGGVVVGAFLLLFGFTIQEALWVFAPFVFMFVTSLMSFEDMVSTFLFIVLVMVGVWIGKEFTIPFMLFATMVTGYWLEKVFAWYQAQQTQTA